MTPAARVASAISILDDILSGQPAEKTLTNWGRSNRYAGSGDRAAIRDHVFSVLRTRRSCVAMGGGETGRSLMIGSLRLAGADPADLFTGQGYGPAPLSETEASQPNTPDMSEGEKLDVPDWLLPDLHRSLGDDFEAVLTLMKSRSPLFLRVNTAKATREHAVEELAKDSVTAVPHDLSDTALLVTENPRRVNNSSAYKNGLVEVQDAASQALVDMLPLNDGDRVLDYCAGGGGKSLAMAARAELKLHAFDAEPQRMRDIPARADRAGAWISVVSSVADLPPKAYDLVLCDAPCSGGGAWRRSPDAKWQLSRERLDELSEIQQEILTKATGYVADGGHLAYATCSLLDQENTDQVAAFLAANPEWSLVFERQFSPLEGGDGFYVALLTRA